MCVTNTINRRRTLNVAGINGVFPVAKQFGKSEEKDINVGNLDLAVASWPGLPLSYGRLPTNEKDIVIPNSCGFWHTIVHPVASVSSDSDSDSKQPRRKRRQPQKPGKTAKLNERHFVVHNYHDHASDCSATTNAEVNALGRRKGGSASTFPLKLHEMLDKIEADGLSHVISWQPHGRAFLVHDAKEFVSHVMPKYFKQTKLTSFQRQLNLYGFCRLTAGPDTRAYYHERFLRGMPFLSLQMTRVKIKGTGFKAASSPENEPDFYLMPPIIVTPPDSGVSDHDSASTDSDSDATSQTHDSTPRFCLPFRDSAPNLMISNVGSFDSVTSFDMSTSLTSEENDDDMNLCPYSFDYGESVIDSFDPEVEEAISELFLQDQTESAAVEDFLPAWISAMPTSEFESFGDTLDSDNQLGAFLEMLMS